MNKAETIQAIKDQCPKYGFILPEHVAYTLATVDHETGRTFQPVREGYYLGSAAEKFRKGLKYWPYYGRGYVQITHKANYQKFGMLLGINLVGNPDLALDEDTAMFILLRGFKDGLFTGKKLQDYVNRHRTDFVGARRCINGTDRADHIATLARSYLRDLRGCE